MEDNLTEMLLQWPSVLFFKTR